MASERQSSDSKREKQSAAKKRTTKLASPQAEAAAPALVQLALTDPSAVAPSIIMALQRSHGNQAVQRLIAQSQSANEGELEVQPHKPSASVTPVRSATEPTLVSQPSVQTTVEAPALDLFSQFRPAYEIGLPSVDDVPPIAPPLAPPPDDNPRHRVGSPFRHLDGFSNRKDQTKVGEQGAIPPKLRRFATRNQKPVFNIKLSEELLEDTQSSSNEF